MRGEQEGHSRGRARSRSPVCSPPSAGRRIRSKLVTVDRSSSAGRSSTTSRTRRVRRRSLSANRCFSPQKRRYKPLYVAPMG